MQRTEEETAVDASILIVDDEPMNVRLLEQVLERGGYERVSSTTDPRRVVPLCREVRPDLILLDLRMPHLDGFGVLDLLQQELEVDDRPTTLVLSADITEEIRKRALLLGAQSLLQKPFDLDEVLTRIGELVRPRASGSEPT